MSIQRSRFYPIINELDSDFEMIDGPSIIYRIKRDEKQTELILELSGIEKDDIKVDIKDVEGSYQLVVSVNSNEESDKTKKPLNCNKTFTLSEDADIERISATYNRNKLIINIPNIEHHHKINNSIPTSIRDPKRMIDEIKVLF